MLELFKISIVMEGLLLLWQMHVFFRKTLESEGSRQL